MYILFGFFVENGGNCHVVNEEMLLYSLLLESHFLEQQNHLFLLLCISSLKEHLFCEEAEDQQSCHVFQAGVKYRCFRN